MKIKRSLGLAVENAPNSTDLRFLEERIHEFNVQSTGISGGELFGIFLRGPDRAVIGGADGWFWGGLCYIRHLFVPEPMRKQGHGTRLMGQIEEEAKARQCAQIVLETHDFQAPDFYRRLGFKVTGVVAGFPRGHQRLTLQKQIGAQSPQAAHQDD